MARYLLFNCSAQTGKPEACKLPAVGGADAMLVVPGAVVRVDCLGPDAARYESLGMLLGQDANAGLAWENVKPGFILSQVGFEYEPPKPKVVVAPTPEPAAPVVVETAPVVVETAPVVVEAEQPAEEPELVTDGNPNPSDEDEDVMVTSDSELDPDVDGN
jgi:hypothetical protein